MVAGIVVKDGASGCFLGWRFTFWICHTDTLPDDETGSGFRACPTRAKYLEHYLVISFVSPPSFKESFTLQVVLQNWSALES